MIRLLPSNDDEPNLWDDSLSSRIVHGVAFDGVVRLVEKTKKACIDFIEERGEGQYVFAVEHARVSYGEWMYDDDE